MCVFVSATGTTVCNNDFNILGAPVNENIFLRHCIVKWGIIFCACVIELGVFPTDKMTHSMRRLSHSSPFLLPSYSSFYRPIPRNINPPAGGKTVEPL